MGGQEERLFGRHDLAKVLQARAREMVEEVEGIEADRLLNTSAGDLCDYLEEKYRVDAPRLIEDDIRTEWGETRVDVSRDPNRYVSDRERPFHVAGTKVSFFVPFEGDGELLKWRPGSFMGDPPAGIVARNEIVLTYTRTDHNADAMKSEFERDLSRIKEWLQQMRDEVCRFNASLRAGAEGHVQGRREKLLKDQGMVAALGYPLRRREDAPQTFVVPTIRRKVGRPMPGASTEAFVSEPTLEMKEYEHILEVIANMAAVIERSPRAFEEMDEENLRQHFLVQLNGQYEGQATGETFNFEGKTDILIRVQGKNIFIAECRIWHGVGYLRRALGQLLKYVTWRDTKAALVVFNRGGNLSKVLPKIQKVVAGHANCKRRVAIEGETRLRYVFGHRDDMSREWLVTVLVFEVPGEYRADLREAKRGAVQANKRGGRSRAVKRGDSSPLGPHLAGRGGGPKGLATSLRMTASGGGWNPRPTEHGEGRGDWAEK